MTERKARTGARYASEKQVFAALRMTTRKTKQEQQQRPECRDLSTAAAKNAASGRDDNAISTRKPL
jgi:hypothetical protein